ncbi:MAG: hypothetical protein ACI8ZB_003773 [Desulforhopalus sp.]|jgi:hypothetical protein
MKSKKHTTLYPTFGEILNEISHILGTKPAYKQNEQFTRNLNKLANEGDFDYTLLNEMLDKIFKSPFPTDFSDFNHTLRTYGGNLIDYYIGILREIPLDGFSRKESIPWLVEHHACIRLVKFIEACQKNYKPLVANLDLFESEYPLRTVWIWIENEFPQFVEFQKQYGGNTSLERKLQRDKEWKWKNGKHIPDNETLWGKHGLLTQFYEKKNINHYGISLVNETVFFAKFLQQFLKNTSSFNTFENLQKMSRNQYIHQSDYSILKQYLPHSENEVIGEAETYLCAVDDLRKRLINAEIICRSEKDDIHEIIMLAEREVDRLEGYNPHCWHISRFHGMWYVLFMEDLEKAIPHYKEAVRGVVYSGDNLRTQKILKEALTLCCTAYLEGIKTVEEKTLRPFLTKLKNQAIALGGYEDCVSEGKKISDNEILFWKNKYKECFRKVWNDQ